MEDEPHRSKIEPFTNHYIIPGYLRASLILGLGQEVLVIGGVDFTLELILN